MVGVLLLIVSFVSCWFGVNGKFCRLVLLVRFVGWCFGVNG